VIALLVTVNLLFLIIAAFSLVNGARRDSELDSGIGAAWMLLTTVNLLIIAVEELL
jgi:hypothetical protein